MNVKTDIITGITVSQIGVWKGELWYF